MLPRRTISKVGILFAAMCLCGTPPVLAQVFDLDKDREPMVVLDGLWRFHPGDDPRWADPAFDDSRWPLISSTNGWSDQGYKNLSGMAWYRVRVRVPQVDMPLAVYIRYITTSYQVFANGKLIGSFGGMPPHPSADIPIPRVFLLPHAPLPGKMGLVIAIRVWHWPMWASYRGGGVFHGVRIGQAELIQTYGASQDMGVAWSNAGYMVMNVLAILAGLTSFTLYMFRRRETEFLWFSLYSFFGAAQMTVVNYSNFHPISVHLHDFLFSDLLGGLSELVEIAFCFRLLKGTKDWLFWSALGAWTFYLAFEIFVDLSPYPLVSYAFLDAANCLHLIPISAWVLVLLIRRVIQGLPDARLVLVPLVLGQFALLSGVVLAIGRQSGWFLISDDWLNDTWQQPIHFSFASATDALFLISVLAILVRRFVISVQHEEALTGEFEDARVVQQVLIPEAIPAFPGFDIQSVYKPFGEVGGDFFQILRTREGGVLVVIGDVSGKGMPAAMAVSLLVGTVRTLAHYTQNPAEILAAMNQRMLARSHGGFTTCLVLRIDSDGILTIANAGHLAPYLNGTELELENGLPLGLSESTIYPQVTHRLEPGKTLTLITDGVVEARARNGELFGFERTAPITVLCAEHIANTAIAFGQQDDITVLTISRAERWEESAVSRTFAVSPSTS